MLRQRHDAGSALALDDTHFPVVIVTWIGPANLASLGTFEEFVGEQLERAAAAGIRLFVIHDCLLAARPTQELRAPIAALGARLKDRIKRGRMMSIIVYDRVVIRTIMSAAVVMNRAQERTRVCSSMKRGIDLALQLGDEAGQARPADLHPDAYRAPDLTVAAV